MIRLRLPANAGSPVADRLLSRAQRVPGRVFPATRRRVDSSASQGEQVLLAQQYWTMRHLGMPSPTMSSVEFRNYSQNGEDGILLYLATVLELERRRIVEIGSSDGIECNAANLILHHGWSGLLLDGDADLIERGVRFYDTQAEGLRIGPRLVHAWITRDNARQLLADHGYGADIDVLSLDIDGIDLWIVEALMPTANVVIVEYNNRLPADVAIAVPYSDSFAGRDVDCDLTYGEGYFGASLLAYARMLGRFGYRLVGANSINTNAFFVRTGCGDDVLAEVSVESCLNSRWAQAQRERWWGKLQDREWVQVEAPDRPHT